ncbi:MAG: hypothetical protein HYY98_10670 [Burkholderiales bacterium]|nr:hypothetical protein [Burkholderiales bacterium]
MISSLLKAVMKEFELHQTGLAEVMGVSLDRVKSLTSGKAKNLKREEGEALIKKLHIRGDWLATGEGPMLQSEGERELDRRMDLLKLASGKAQIAGLESHYMRALQEILFFAELGDAVALRKALTQLQPDEMALVGSYRNCSEDGKVRLIQQAAVLSAGLPTGQGKSAGAENAVNQRAVGDNAIQIGSVTGKARIKNR